MFVFTCNIFDELMSTFRKSPGQVTAKKTMSFTCNI